VLSLAKTSSFRRTYRSTEHPVRRGGRVSSMATPVPTPTGMAKLWPSTMK